MRWPEGGSVLPPTVKPRPSSRYVIFIAALALTGCGVAGYEKQMQEAEVRIQRFDEENRLLGDPLELPALPKELAVTLFLRPPKGVVNSSKKDDIPYHYPATSGVCTDLYLAINEGREKAEKLIEERLGSTALNWQPVEVNPPGRPPIAFETVEFFDPKVPANTAVYVAYVHQSAGRPAVGVVFRVLKSNRDAAGPSLKMSMESYAEAGDAFKARDDFKKRGAH
jgi:hypothetical protein